MKRPFAAALSSLVAVLFVGCATTVVDLTRTESRARHARAADYPIELCEEDLPASPNKVIGSVRVRVKLSESGEKVAPRSRIIRAGCSPATARSGAH